MSAYIIRDVFAAREQVRWWRCALLDEPRVPNLVASSDELYRRAAGKRNGWMLIGRQQIWHTHYCTRWRRRYLSLSPPHYWVASIKNGLSKKRQLGDVGSHLRQPAWEKTRNIWRQHAGGLNLFCIDLSVGCLISLYINTTFLCYKLCSSCQPASNGDGYTRKQTAGLGFKIIYGVQYSTFESNKISRPAAESWGDEED